MNDRAFAAELAALLKGEHDIDDAFEGTGIRYAVPFDEAWLVTQDAGVVVCLRDGSEFQVTVVRRRGPRS